MKTLSPDKIECLLGIRAFDAHPLDILGYGYSSEGARRFRAERPNFLPQIASYVRSVLAGAGIFPRETNLNDPGYSTLIRADGASFIISGMEEIGFSRFGRFSSGPMSETEAIHEYIRRVSNPDYVRFPNPMS